MQTGPVENWFNLMQKAMDVLDIQHQVVSSNIANVNTPAFHKLQMDFKAELNQAISNENGDSLAMRQVPNSVAPDDNAAEIIPTQDTTTPARADGNNVRLEREMVDLAQTNEVYATLSRVASKNIRIMRYVISGGK